MAEGRNKNRVLLDLNNEVFQENWLGLDKVERNRVTDTLKKLNQQTWEQVYRDAGLKWEKIVSVKPPQPTFRRSRVGYLPPNRVS